MDADASSVVAVATTATAAIPGALFVAKRIVDRERKDKKAIADLTGTVQGFEVKLSQKEVELSQKEVELSQKTIEISDLRSEKSMMCKKVRQQEEEILMLRRQIERADVVNKLILLDRIEGLQQLGEEKSKSARLEGQLQLLRAITVSLVIPERFKGKRKALFYKLELKVQDQVLMHLDLPEPGPEERKISFPLSVEINVTEVVKKLLSWLWL